MSRHCPPAWPSASLSIRQEIQRFESVHPCIYAVYELLELLPPEVAPVAQQIRDHVVCIEDSFVNSQEWTSSRGVTELRVGVLGSTDSGKSALVHRYLTGAYMQEDSPEGGRFKKEVVIDGHSYLLLIRDEGGPPEMQFTAWVDAVIFVFSLDSDSSYNTVYNFYNKMSHYRNSAEIPVILVGTQDSISESSPRVVDDNRSRKLATELRRCSYYETCATYGLNVERVFQDACQKVVGSRLSLSTQLGSRPVTPQPALPSSPSHNHSTFLYKDPRGQHSLSSSSHHLHRAPASLDASSNSSGVSSTHVVEIHSSNGSDSVRWPLPDNNNKFVQPQCVETLQVKDLPTPSSTPTTSRKSRRRSNLFTPSKKEDRLKSGELGSGRAIPLKQGYLYKKSSKALNKEWKKKYVTLCDDGRLTYHPSLHDYMSDVNGKEISLQYVTVKLPGQKPRGSKSITTVPGGYSYTNNLHRAMNNMAISYKDVNKSSRATDKALLSAFETMKEPGGRVDGEEVIGSTNGDVGKETPHVKKRHRRMKSGGMKNGDEEGDSYTSSEFTIVSLEGKRWRWEVGGGGAGAAAERDAWVACVEAQILASLQGRTSHQPLPTGANTTGEVGATRFIRRVRGNDQCCDCGAPEPDWASLNLGVLICIECCGVHRNLGSHVSRVRSLDLDQWPLSYVSVMVTMGNTLANSIWEADLRGHVKPSAGSPRDDKETWIRLKYERKAFLSCVPPAISLDESYLESEGAAGRAGSLLRRCAARGDMSNLARLLAGTPAPSSTNTNSSSGSALSAHDRSLALRAACAAGQLAAAQMLIWHNGNPNYPDADNHTCVFYARAAAGHLAGLPRQLPANLQLACPLHPAPAPAPAPAPDRPDRPDDCNCVMFELLHAENACGALVELLLGLCGAGGAGAANGHAPHYEYSNGSVAAYGRASIGPPLSISNGKCSGSVV